MTTRQRVSSPFEPGLTLPSGYNGNNIPGDFAIPPCGLVDVDKALFDLFDKELALQITQKNKTEDVPTIFAGRERFANVRPVRKNKPIRDKNNTIVLPVVSIRRTNIDQSDMHYKGRALGQDTGDLVIRRRLSKKDANWQTIINKALLQNQDNVSTSKHLINDTSPENVEGGKFATRRIGRANNQTHPTGKILDPELGNNIFEIITMPFPHFYVASYEITFWTQYFQHMNELIERLMTQYHAQGNQFRIETDKGYWFVAYFEDDVANKDNVDDYSEEERILRYSFNVKVPGFMIAPDNSGDMSPFRRYLSAPQIAFNICEEDSINIKTEGVGTGDLDKFILNEVQELDQFGNPITTAPVKNKVGKRFVKNPFTGEEEVQLAQLVSQNRRSGESVASTLIPKDLGKLIL